MDTKIIPKPIKTNSLTKHNKPKPFVDLVQYSIKQS